MSGKRFEGKNLEEAIDSAARAFGVESFRVSYHVVLEKRGFLGGTKRVVIEAEVSGSAPAEEKKPAKERERKPQRPARSERPAPAGPRPPKDQRPDKSERPARSDRAAKRPARPERPARSENPPRQESSMWEFEETQGEKSAPAGEAAEGRSASERDSSGSQSRPERDRQQKGSGRSSRRRGRRGRGGRARQNGESEEKPFEAKAFEPSGPVEIPEQGEQSPDAARVAEWCETIFRLSDLDLVARTRDLDEEIAVELFGRDAGIVEQTDYLDSLQVLANKVFTGRSIEKRIELDAAGFKRRREEDLAEKAREMADRVREEGRERTMRAMSPIERRIVHVTLQEEQGVTTESRGRGFHKRVAILPAEEEQTAAGES